MVTDKGYWWCPQCKKPVLGIDVVGACPQEARHDVSGFRCGGPVEWRTGNPNPERAARMERLRKLVVWLRLLAMDAKHASELPIRKLHRRQADDIEAVLKEVADGENRG